MVCPTSEIHECNANHNDARVRDTAALLDQIARCPFTYVSMIAPISLSCTQVRRVPTYNLPQSSAPPPPTRSSSATL
jgi:hypothetical protein